MFNERKQIGDDKLIKRLSQGQQAEKIVFKTSVTQSEKNKKTKSLTIPAVTISLAILLLAGAPIAGYVAYQTSGLFYQADEVKKDFSSMSKQEMELLLEDVNPMVLKKLADDPEMKKQQIESLKQLLAMASAAQKDPQIYNDSTQKGLAIIDAVIWARTYDQEIHKGKDSTPFSSVTETQVKTFYGEGSNLTPEQKQHAQEFDEFLKIQLEFGRKNNSVPEDTQPTEDEKKEMRKEFARIKIYETEAKAKVKSGELPEKFVRKVALQSKLQQAQFLSRMYSTDVLAKKTEATDDDVQVYLAQHPEFNKAKEQKAKALQILQRVKNGEDFAALAKEFSDDPANKDKGGLYEGVTEGGGFDTKFEAAALSLAPGQFTQDLVETQFGYHIIKLERKSKAKDQNGKVKQIYDVRHIFFSTMIKDPDNLTAREMPVNEYVKSKIEDDKQKKAVDKILADNPVSVAEDFQIRKVSDEEIRKSQQQMSNSASNSTSNMQSNSASNSASNSNRKNVNK